MQRNPPPLPRRLMRFASARCILWLLQQRRPVTSPLGVVRRKSTSGDRFHALAIDGGESVAAKVYHTRGKSAILEDPSANRLWIRIDQELRAPRDCQWIVHPHQSSKRHGIRISPAR